MTIDGSNWLDCKVVECANCGQKLHWLWHSPMYDSTFFYCTECPKRVEVSHYDEVALRLRELAEKDTPGTSEMSAKFFALVEQNLAACDCGGNFSYAASRRCLRCFSVLSQSEPGRDVWPPESADENFDPEYQTLSFPIESLVKTENIWITQAPGTSSSAR